MIQIPDKQLRFAFLRWWNRSFPSQEYDTALGPFLDKNISAARSQGWLRAAREGSMKSVAEAAEQVGISKQAFAQFEAKEKQGKITIETLARLADSLDCELVYAIRPKSKRRFSAIIWEQLTEAAEGHGWIRHASIHNKGRALAKVATDKFRNPDFRKKKGWNKRVLPAK